MKLAIILFLLTYVFIFVFPTYKHLVALFSAILFILFGILPINNIIPSIDFNVILMIFGIMGTVNLFIDSNMPSKISDYIIDKCKNVKSMTVVLAIFAGIVSAFVDNVATVLMIAPVALTISKKIKISPVPILIAISIFSNLEGAATLVGDTTSILLASSANMNFLDFFIYKNKIGLFFIVQIGLIFSSIILYKKMHNKNQLIKNTFDTKVNDYFPSYLLLFTILTLIMISFIPNKISIANGIICVSFYILGLIYEILKNPSKNIILNQIKKIDYQTLLLLTCLFIVIGGIKSAGIIDSISQIFITVSDNPFILYTCIVFFSCLISAFIDNIPYVATMLPVVSSISFKLGIDPTVLYYGLIIGATLGGNLTPIGASANIASIGILNKNGYNVTTKEYLKFSLPITLVAVFSGYLVVYFMFF